jgi:hypothetical protein
MKKIQKALEIARRWQQQAKDPKIPFRQNDEVFEFDPATEEHEFPELIVANALVLVVEELTRLAEEVERHRDYGTPIMTHNLESEGH